MKILSKYITGATQIHTGKCYYIGMTVESGKEVKAYNVETSGSAATANQVGYLHSGGVVILPKPGVECTNGLYIGGSALMQIFYSLG